MKVHEDAKDDSQQLMADAVSKELKDVILSAMRRLKPRHRAILTLRCFRQMRYEHIAESMQCTQFGAKVQFYRAKKAMQKQLARQGFSGGMFVTALVIFGKITAPSEAVAKVIAIPAAMTKVGVAAGLAAMATTKAGILAATAAGVITLGTIVATPGTNQATAPPTEGPAISSQITASAAAKGVREYWHYYPQGANGPVMMRLLKWDPRAKRSYCQWLQNERANYEFDRDKNTVFVRNHRSWRDDLSVWRLPTDNTNLQESLAQPKGPPMQYVRNDGAGLLVILKLNEKSHHSQIARHLNVLDEQYFLYNWPSRATIIDARDAMHKRGWTYFRVSGELSGQKVSGTGRIPFVYATSKWNYPWLKLTIGDKFRLVDTGAEARLYDNAGKPAARHQGGSFFQGLSRPWTGLHTIDTVRRDAANEQMPFETQYDRGRDTAKITITCARTRLTYTIDMEKDVVKTITFSTDDNLKGVLNFTYLQDVGEAAREFVSPRQESPPKWQRDRLGIMWLAKLMDARW